ncbi:translation initiation factor IF-2-like [Molothrus ater]|uniref:translation initiation factor IF-2-like n=1 Tax=Molothrus ater TaxID=84834 RepID=UPI00174CFCDC|nr:translation initiation factor IF-2-like [Molothrus ater]
MLNLKPGADRSRLSGPDRAGLPPAQSGSCSGQGPELRRGAAGPGLRWSGTTNAARAAARGRQVSLPRRSPPDPAPAPGRAPLQPRALLGSSPGPSAAAPGPPRLQPRARPGPAPAQSGRPLAAAARSAPRNPLPGGAGGRQSPAFRGGWCRGGCVGTFLAVLGSRPLQGEDCWSERDKDDFQAGTRWMSQDLLENSLLKLPVPAPGSWAAPTVLIAATASWGRGSSGAVSGPLPCPEGLPGLGTAAVGAALGAGAPRPRPARSGPAPPGPAPPSPRPLAAAAARDRALGPPAATGQQPPGTGHGPRRAPAAGMTARPRPELRRGLRAEPGEYRAGAAPGGSGTGRERHRAGAVPGGSGTGRERYRAGAAPGGSGTGRERYRAGAAPGGSGTGRERYRAGAAPGGSGAGRHRRVAALRVPAGLVQLPVPGPREPHRAALDGRVRCRWSGREPRAAPAAPVRSRGRRWSGELSGLRAVRSCRDRGTGTGIAIAAPSLRLPGSSC